uniref:tRNA wybutosinesynthesizing protein putative n=1 Tax=Albugo laibachii Nc14 TaxID=890382 RepID=F0W0R4_9STRA|nr:tRNA wybutosinesynthesizing protein putative [Albugo laibachii Nc14]|eukprot:CCA14638.1 tRNA wybutosinesynthesizing protein putative [Albugo laibachii Nc14]
MCAVRSTSNTLEVPLAKCSRILVDENYLSWIVEIANERFRRNEERVNQLRIAFRQQFGQGVPIPVKAPSNILYVRPMVDVSLSLRRVGHTIVYHKGHLIVFGGEGYTENDNVRRLSSVQLLKLSENEKDQPIIDEQKIANDDIVRARMYHSSSIDVKSEQMIVFGGRASPSKAYGDTLALCLSTFTWTQILPDSGGVLTPVIPAARWNHVACIAGSKLYIHGGRDSSTVFHDLWVLDVAAPKGKLAWRLLSSELVYAAFDHVGMYVSRQNKLLFWGGLATLSGIEVARGNANACYLFDLETETWEEKSIGNTKLGPRTTRFGATISALGNECDVVLIVGGTSASISRVSRAEEPFYALNTTDLQWQSARIICEHDSSSLVHSASTWAPQPYNAIYITGGGFQCYGFAYHYASSVCCVLDAPMILSTKNVAVNYTQHKQELSTGSLGVLTARQRVKWMKTLLEKVSVYDKTRRVHEVAGEEVSAGVYLLPVTSDIHTALSTYDELADCVSSTDIVEDSNALKNKCGKSSGMTRDERIRTIITRFAHSRDVSESEIFKSISGGFEYIGDIILLNSTCCAEKESWGSFEQEMWACICEQVVPCLTRVAREARIDNGEMRRSRVSLIYVNQDRWKQQAVHQEVCNIPNTTESPGWVEVRENGIVYGLDITKTMFSSGNITEKARMAGISCKGEIIVDLFCGIGYYVLPFLVHGGASMVHACDWNPDAITALQYNLLRNRVSERCTIHEGDNQVSARKIGPISDRVNLGLLPKSDKAWPLAVQVLKSSGGWLHVHENVPKQELKAWIEHVECSIETLAKEIDRNWIVTCHHVEKVKSYAPRIYHYVADIHCVAVDSTCK